MLAVTGEEGWDVEALPLRSGWRMWKRWGMSLEMLRFEGVEMLEGRLEDIAQRDS